MKKYIIRFLGACLGLVAVLFGVYELTLESSGTLSLINELCFIIVGVVFVFYGLTGKSFFNETINKKPDSNENE